MELKYLKGVGEVRASLLAKELEIHTMRDLVMYFPFRHVDRSRFYNISELGENMPALQVKGRFISFYTEGEGRKKRLNATFTDGSRMMTVTWFSKINVIADMYRVGKEYVIFGTPKIYRNAVSMVHPEVEEFNPDRPPSGLRGVYSLTETLRKRGITSRLIRDLVDQALAHPSFIKSSETLPQEIISRYGLMPFHEAVKSMHNPSSARQLQLATERMKFEELFYVELHILRYARRRSKVLSGYVFPKIGELFNGFYFHGLPFQLTGAQKRVLHEIRDDMRSGRQMNRLLQGDVGCGKTMVAFMTMLMAADNGCQSAIMAPTEILAAQHFESISAWAAPLGIKVALLTGSTRSKARRLALEGLASGEILIAVGTHALLEERVVFNRLALAVIDEQHRFGVAQRARMWNKNSVAPHVLVMTATPIPRTLAMTVYGDLDVSVIDELPPGRKPVQTYLRYDDNRMEVNRLIYSQLREGRQIYIVYPLVHENEKLDLRSLEEGYERVRETFSDYRVCYVHGQMKPAEKDHQMNLFVSGEARILVATTVIEVGVNVPNASVMVIENAERFGLSQLHQLRGRVGRGADKSYCILMSRHNIGRDTKKRLGIMTETSDGFLISEADMQIRGPGDMEGTQQSGLAFNLRVASLARDGQILTRAREAAEAILDENPSLVADSSATVQNPSRTNSVGSGIVLSASSLAILNSEIHTRFEKSVDWSLIS